MKTPPQFQPIDDNTQLIIVNVWLASGILCVAVDNYRVMLVAFAFALAQAIMMVVKGYRLHKELRPTNNP